MITKIFDFRTTASRSRRASGGFRGGPTVIAVPVYRYDPTMACDPVIAYSNRYETTSEAPSRSTAPTRCRPKIEDFRDHGRPPVFRTTLRGSLRSPLRLEASLHSIGRPRYLRQSAIFGTTKDGSASRFSIIPELADCRRQRGRPIEGREASRRSGVLASEASEGSAERSSAGDRREPRSVVRKIFDLP